MSSYDFQDERPTRSSVWLKIAIPLLVLGATAWLWWPLLRNALSDPSRQDSSIAPDDRETINQESRVAIARHSLKTELPWYATVQPRLPITPLVQWEREKVFTGNVRTAQPAPGGGVICLSDTGMYKVTAKGETRLLSDLDQLMMAEIARISPAGDVLLTAMDFAALYSKEGEQQWRWNEDSVYDLDSLLGASLLRNSGKCIIAYGDSAYGDRHNGLLVMVSPGGRTLEERSLPGLVQFKPAADGSCYAVASADPKDPGLQLMRFVDRLKPEWTVKVDQAAEGVELKPQGSHGVILEQNHSATGGAATLFYDSHGKQVWKLDQHLSPPYKHEAPDTADKLWLTSTNLEQSQLVRASFKPGGPAPLKVDLPPGSGLRMEFPDGSALATQLVRANGGSNMSQGFICVGPDGKARWSFRTTEGMPYRDICVLGGSVMLFGVRTIYTCKFDGSDLKLWHIPRADSGWAVTAPEGVYLFLANGDVMLLKAPP